MKLSQAKEYLPFVQAAADGKTIQNNNGGEWVDVTEPGFSMSPNSYRIKPSPTLRPWRPEEVPVGALLRPITTSSLNKDIELIIGVSTLEGNAVLYTGFGYERTAEVILRDKEHSLDQGKTWLPCGVLE